MALLALGVVFGCGKVSRDFAEAEDAGLSPQGRGDASTEDAPCPGPDDCPPEGADDADDDAPAPDDDAPLLDDDGPAADDDVPAPDDDAPLLDDDVPAPDDDAPPLDDDGPAADDDASLTDDDVLGPDETTPRSDGGAMPCSEGCDCQDGDERPCTEGGLFGPCAVGKQVCDASGNWGSCSIPPADYDGCAAGNDDNCDGQANAPLDPSCDCAEAETRSCAEGGFLGSCADGTQSCSSAGEWGPCSVTPLTADLCTPDNDATCNGVPNEDCACIVDDTGACPCSPGDRGCDGNVPERCDDTTLEWVSEDPCPETTPCQGAGLCQACGEGTYSSAGVCQPWSDCSPGEYVTGAATSTSDWQCGACAAGTFSTTNNAESCAAWVTCAPGQYVSLAGSPNANRQCSPCPYGFFSTTNNASTCTAWTPCPTGTSQTAPGTALGDRTCGPIPSCQGLTNDCGAAQNESCCTTLPVTGDSFVRGDAACRVSSYSLDKFEVTVGRFRKFKAAWDGGYRPTAGAGKHTHLNGGSGLVDGDDPTAYEPGWRTAWASEVDTSNAARACDADFATWTASAGANERRPINCVNLPEAYAFCIWDGGFIPSETEWIFAAAGGDQQRHYPWSNPPSSTLFDGTLGSFWVDSTQECQGDGVNGCTLADLIWVGLKAGGNGRYGQADLGGNVWEWTLDLYQVSDPECDDCTFFSTSSAAHAAHGGGYDSRSDDLRPEEWSNPWYTDRYRNLGFRCARSL